MFPLSLNFQMGPVFTLYMTGKRMTFVTEPEDFHHFFQSDKVDFQKALQEPVQNVGKLCLMWTFYMCIKVY